MPVTPAQALELPLFRDVLDVFVKVARILDRPAFLGSVFKAITTRLDYVSADNSQVFLLD